jgi:hypothetical protein
MLFFDRGARRFLHRRRLASFIRGSSLSELRWRSGAGAEWFADSLEVVIGLRWTFVHLSSHDISMVLLPLFHRRSSESCGDGRFLPASGFWRGLIRELWTSSDWRRK